MATSAFELNDLGACGPACSHLNLDVCNSSEVENFINDFPKSTYKGQAQKKVQKCQDILAQNIFEIGKFYFRTGSYQSAIIRLKSFMTEYPTHSFIAESEFLLAESYFHEQNYNQAQTHYKIVLKKYEYFKTIETLKRIASDLY